MESERIDEGHDEVARMVKAYAQVGGLPDTVITDRSHPVHAAALETYKQTRRAEAEQFNAMSILRQWQDNVIHAVNHLVRLVIAISYKGGTRVERTLIGDMKTRVHRKRAEMFADITRTT